MWRIAQIVLWCASALAVFLALGWPFVVSPDPASATYRALAIVALAGILGAIVAIAARKLLAARPRG
jgi:hypothetical protein